MSILDKIAVEKITCKRWKYRTDDQSIILENKKCCSIRYFSIPSEVDYSFFLFCALSVPSSMRLTATHMMLTLAMKCDV